MDIDLLFTDRGEGGLICNGNLVKKAAGLLVDAQTGLMTLEYVDMDFMEMNIAIDEAFIGMLEHNPQIHIGAVKNGNIAQAYQIPLMFLDDPYRAEAMKNTKQAQNPLLAFERFVKSCTNGQPAHREDLGNEDSTGCVLGSSTPSSLQFAPHLARQHALEAAPKAAPEHMPRFAGPGLGSSGGGRPAQRRPARRNPDTDDD